ncbi:cytochrome c oxidase subunit NDUFA4-like [Dysidea avara]|uniref:cytochrome c oxidase subunit NDUFA4-like n=1 Tax=Dysidea avara TaxID=196820 RepID=UPI003331053D
MAFLSNIVRQMRRSPEVIPLVAIVSAGCVMGISALVRISVVHPEISFDRHSNPHPFLKHDADSNKCFKVFAVVDYGKKINENPPKY